MEDEKDIEQVETKPDPKDQELEALRMKLAELETDKKKAIEKREAEKIRAREEAEKNRQYEDALALIKDELSLVKSKYNEVEIEELKTTKDKYQKLVDQQKAALLEKFPEDKRDKFKSYELDQLSEIANMIGIDPVIPSVESKKKSISGSVTKPWNEMNQSERDSLFEANPNVAKKLIREAVLNGKAK